MCHPVVLRAGPQRVHEVAVASYLEAQVCELQGKTIAKRGSFRKIAAPVSTDRIKRLAQRLLESLA